MRHRKALLEVGCDITVREAVPEVPADAGGVARRAVRVGDNEGKTGVKVV